MSDWMIRDLKLANDTVARLRVERDRLRNEVVKLRGQHKHRYGAVSVEPGVRTLYECKRCGNVTSAPVHAYFHPCSMVPIRDPVLPRKVQRPYTISVTGPEGTATTVHWNGWRIEFSGEDLRAFPPEGVTPPPGKVCLAVHKTSIIRDMAGQELERKTAVLGVDEVLRVLSLASEMINAENEPRVEEE